MTKLLYTLGLTIVLLQPLSCLAANTHEETILVGLLNDDHGVLSKLKIKKVNIPYQKLKPAIGQTLWQCFPREKVRVSLIDTGYSSSDLGWKEDHSNIVVTINESKNVKHEYTMRRFFGLDMYQKRFNYWIDLMRNQSFVCLSGEYIEQEKMNNKYQHYTLISWLFDGIKTKVGSDFYFPHS